MRAVRLHLFFVSSAMLALSCTSDSAVVRDDSGAERAGDPIPTPDDVEAGGTPTPPAVPHDSPTAPTAPEEPTAVPNDTPSAPTVPEVPHDMPTEVPAVPNDMPETTEPAEEEAEADAGLSSLRVLVFSRTVEYRHASIPAGIAAFERLAGERSWELATSEDPALFTDESLSTFDVVVFLMTTGDVLDAEQQAAFERFIRSGKGFVGVHSASDTEYDWPWYGELVGAYFDAHGAVQTASVDVEEPMHPAAQGLPSPWVRRDEWYGFRTNPRAHVHVVLNLDESSFDPGPGRMGEDHPIAWYREYDGGRSFYTALGHTVESYDEPEFTQHLAGAVEWAGRVH